MRKLFVCIIALTCVQLMYAQIPSNLFFLNVDREDVQSGNLSLNQQRDFFNRIVGDTIRIFTDCDRTDFLRADTVRIKKSKKPVLGKHFIVKKHYKSDDNDLNTPKEAIAEKLWIVKKHFKESSDNTLTNHFLELEDVSSGDIVQWAYFSYYYEFGRNCQISFEDITLSHKLVKDFNDEKYYYKLGKLPKFERVGIDDIKVFLKSKEDETNYFESLFIIYSDGIKYKPSKSGKNETKWYTEKQMNEELARLRGAGTYSLFLSNVIKPKNPQIRKGKITPQTDKNGKLSQFAYTDNYFSFIWQPYNKGFYLILENNTDNNVKIEWDEITYVNMEKSVDHVFHKGVKYNDKGKSQPPTVIPSQTKLQDYLMPSSLTTYNSGLNLWISANIISFKDSYNPYYVGKTVKMVFPISVKDMKLEYIFEFKTKWTWDYPEQHEDDKVVE